MGNQQQIKNEERENFIRALENKGYTKPEGEHALLQRNFSSYEINFLVYIPPLNGFRVAAHVWYTGADNGHLIHSIKFRNYNPHNIEKAHREFVSAIKEKFIPKMMAQLELPKELEAIVE